MREPYDGEALLDFLEARAVAGIEEVAGGRYRRTLAPAGGPAVVTVTPAAGGVSCELELSDPDDADDALACCGRLFDVDADPKPIAATLASDPLLEPLVRRQPGLRVPGATDGFELGVRAIAGQQISVSAAGTLIGRLVAEYGEPLPGQRTPAAGLVARAREPLAHAPLARLFPTPAALAQADPGALPFPRARAEALLAFAAAVAAGELSLDRNADAAAARAAFEELPGVGPWTASYVAMRALGDSDVFLPGDAGVRAALARLPGEPEPERWRPFRSYAVLHLWRSLTR